ncbi:MAG TPA: hypothetical protein VJ875_04450, partial [Pyrinomonadaceae bacterium]|nr:hypothetical protein [Pyrinomonadaceae bacterium]
MWSTFSAHRLTFRSIASAILVICLLSSSTPAAPQVITAVAHETNIAAVIWYHRSGLQKLLQGQSFGGAKEQERQTDREARVSRLEIFPKDPTVDLSDHVSFSAVAYDSENNTVGGVKVTWKGQGTTATQRVRIS